VGQLGGIYPVPMPTQGQSKQVAKQQRDAELLRELCADNPSHFELLQQVLQVMQTTSLLPRKQQRRGGVELVLDAYLKRTKP